MHKFLRGISRTLLIALAVIALLLTGSLIALMRGIAWDSLSLANVTLEGGHLQLASKLTLDIERVVVSTAEPRDVPDEPVDPADLQTLLKLTKALSLLFASVDIRKIEMGSADGNFSYRDQGRGHLNATGEGVSMALALSTSGERLIVDIDKLVAMKNQISLTGQASIHTRKRVMEAQLNALLANELAMSIALEADKDRVTFQGRGEKPVKQIATIVELFDLSPDIVKWISGYTRGSEYVLHEFSGTIPYDNPAVLLQTLKAEAAVIDTRYTFAQGLQPATAAETQIIFGEGVLHIYPRDSYFYGQSGGDSYVDIDFSNNRFLLSVFVRTRAQVSGGILELMDFYDIPLPCEQVEGLTDANLVLTIDLESEDIEATGRFTATDSVFTLGGEQRYDVKNLDIALDSSVVSFNRLDIALSELVAADVDGLIDFGRDTGNLNIGLRHFYWPDKDISLLLQTAETLDIAYKIDPLGDSISIPPSRWQTGDLQVQIGTFSGPFDPRNFSGSLDAVAIGIDPGIKATVTGSYQSVAPYANLTISLQELDVGNVRLQQASVDIDVLVKENSLIAVKPATRLSANGFDIVLEPLSASYHEDTLRIAQSEFKLGSHISGSFQGYYDFAHSSSALALNDLRLEKRTGNGKLLSGQLSISRSGTQAPFALVGEISAPSAMLVDQDHRPISEYHLSGTSDENGFELDINHALAIRWSDTLQISSKGLGFRLPVILDAVSAAMSAGTTSTTDLEAPQDSVMTNLTVDVLAQDSAIWIDDKRRMPADTIALQVRDSGLKAQLEYDSGLADLEYTDGTFLLAGAGFNNDFFDPLLDLAVFEGGTMRFNLEGTVSHINGVVRIENTVIKDYKNLNNMLAFANTLPGLLTFNPPNYNRNGLPVREGYAEFQLDDGVLELAALLIESDELSLTGAGTINIKEETTDMTFEMESGVSKSIARIPLLGYIIAGGEEEEEHSLVLKAEGNLYDPDISNSAAKDVLTYPLQLVKRTIRLPSHVVEKSSTKSNANKEKSEAGMRLIH